MPCSAGQGTAQASETSVPETERRCLEIELLRVEHLSWNVTDLGTEASEQEELSSCVEKDLIQQTHGERAMELVFV